MRAIPTSCSASCASITGGCTAIFSTISCPSSGASIYGAGNNGYDDQNEGTCRVFAYDPAINVIRDLGALRDPATGANASNIHMIVEGEPGTLYLGENDNLYRSSYLWEVKVADLGD